MPDLDLILTNPINHQIENVLSIIWNPLTYITIKRTIISFHSYLLILWHLWISTHYYQDHDCVLERDWQHPHAICKLTYNNSPLHKQHSALDSTCIDPPSVMLHDAKDDHKSISQLFKILYNEISFEGCNMKSSSTFIIFFIHLIVSTIHYWNKIWIV